MIFVRYHCDGFIGILGGSAARLLGGAGLLFRRGHYCLGEVLDNIEPMDDYI